MPLQVWGEPEFKRESVEDFGIVFWGGFSGEEAGKEGKVPRIVKVFLPFIISA